MNTLRVDSRLNAARLQLNRVPVAAAQQLRVDHRLNAARLQLDRVPVAAAQPTALVGLDTVTLGLWLAVLMIGVAGVGSASMEKSMTQYHYAFGYLVRHLVYVAVAVGAALTTLLVPLRLWMKYGRLTFLVGLLLLALVLFSRPVNGAHRWLELHFFTVQPSEIMKHPVLRSQ